MPVLGTSLADKLFFPFRWPRSSVRIMNKNSDFDDKDLINEHPAPDPLAEVYTEMISPDIEEINEHAAALAEEAETEPDTLK